MIYLVSACLLGIRTTYDHSSHPHPRLIELAARGCVVPLCPEVAAGLPIPRPPAEMVGGDGHAVLDGRARVLTCDGDDVTAAFVAGAHIALQTARRFAAGVAILQPRSPSCGPHRVYDGQFNGCLVSGQGVTAALLARHGIRVLSPDEFDPPTLSDR